jgi:hypothetical protein
MKWAINHESLPICFPTRCPDQKPKAKNQKPKAPTCYLFHTVFCASAAVFRDLSVATIAAAS